MADSGPFWVVCDEPRMEKGYRSWFRWDLGGGLGRLGVRSAVAELVLGEDLELRLPLRLVGCNLLVRLGLGLLETRDLVLLRLGHDLRRVPLRLQQLLDADVGLG